MLRTLEYIKLRASTGITGEDVEDLMVTLEDAICDITTGISAGKQLRDDNRARIKVLEEDNEALKHEVSRLRAIIHEGPTLASNGQRSFAAVAAAAPAVGAGMKQPRPPPPLNSTVIRAAGKSGKEVAQMAKDKIGQRQQQVQAQVRVLGDGAVRITCDTKDRLEAAKKLIQGNGVTIHDRQLLRPQVRIEGTDAAIGSSDGLIDTINELNGSVLDASSKIVLKTKNWRDKDKVDIVIETSGRAQQKMLRTGTVLLGFERCRVYEHLRLRQCMKCLAIGHKREQCRACDRCLKVGCKDQNCNSRLICLRCGGNHMRKDCPPNSQQMCSVCLHHGQEIGGKHTKDNANHPMLGRDCPLKALGEEQMRRRTDYESQ